MLFEKGFLSVWRDIVLCEKGFVCGWRGIVLCEQGLVCVGGGVLCCVCGGVLYDELMFFFSFLRCATVFFGVYFMVCCFEKIVTVCVFCRSLM